jgi:hypothetical protein
MPSPTYTVSIDGIKYTVAAETRVEARWFAARKYVRYRYGSADVDPGAFAIKADIIDAPPSD